ncbi:HIT domain-containing protein [Pantoea sp. Mhis]|uniref:HIT domain-containing protein n=1 Tax=Pantoea sp. Mhis TaxID=2576759 RepID=UPI00135ACEB0|nr:HIT domain-containing protein [Pantoea sp. Mhis]MXP56314.1 HIT domain-containing protein [Pantoea sp. Mhis]
MFKETIFSKIIRREILADIVYQDELITGFRDISPKAPIHILIVPNILIPTLNDVTIVHQQILGHMLIIASKIAYKEKISKNGYRLIINCNEHGAQEIYHLHIHLLGGQRLGPMLTTLKNK